MRDWLSHRILVVLFERRRDGTISKAGCKEVRESVKRGQLGEAVEYLEREAEAGEAPPSEWLETPLLTAVEDWEQEGELTESAARRVRAHLDAGEWRAAVEAVLDAAEERVF